ncbi:MAG: hypothetical protein H6730_35285 [Deltaproteobacteria bacterium]|nr:hypothetical protein [Deltaproteobacteria bacterium]
MPLLLLAGCGAEPAVGTMVLAVGDVPEDVQTISVFVREVDSAALVATATLTVPTRRVSLGVPAEVPLELNAVARSEQPASEALGGRMPVYVARTVRTVPLGNEQYVAALDARPGGGLTVVLDGDPEAGGELPLRLVGEADPRPITQDAPRRGVHLVRALVAGRWGLSSDDDGWSIPGGEGLWVAPGIETWARLSLIRTPATVAPGAPRTLTVTLLDADGSPVDPARVPTSSVAEPLEVEIVALDEAGAPVAVPTATVLLSPRSVPAGLWSRPALSTTGLPARLLGWGLRGPGRATLDVHAVLDDGRTLIARWAGNAGEAGGPPAAVHLELASSDALVAGTVLRVDLLDAAGRFAVPAPVAVDLEGSDPWVFWPAGAAFAGEGPHLSGPVARPSGPLGLPVEIRAVATSTAFPGTWRATVTLPGGGS